MQKLGAVAALTTLCVLAGVSLGGAALARTPYLLPNAFDAERDHITLQGALTEDDYFNPDSPLKAEVYQETTPDGAHRAIAPTAILKDLAIIEAPLPQTGTYRFSTGAFVGRTMSMAKVDGRWMMVRPVGGGDHRPPVSDHAGPDSGKPAGEGPPPGLTEADVPAGAARMTVDNVMTVETYVSKGAPTKAALQPSGHGLELKPITHPNSIYVDQGFAFQLLIDGAPAPGVGVTVYRAGDVYDEHKIAAEAKTGAGGEAKLSFDRPGVYLLTAHYPGGARAPDAPPAARAYVYSLTFEVTR
jgi:hypothetical protein